MKAPTPSLDYSISQASCQEEDESVNLVRLRLITHNARLIDARKDRAMTAEAMAQTAQISRDRLRRIENLKVIPTEEELCKIACILEKPIDYLFPEALLDAVKAGVFSRREVELAVPEVISLTEAQRLRLTYDGEATLIEQVSRTMLAEQITEVLETLTPKERKVIRLRFGLEDGCSRNLEEVGKEFGGTRARIRQIEGKALRKLRHPCHSRKLMAYLE